MSAVIMLVNEFPPLSVGGAELQAERLSANLAARGLKVGVITRGAPGLPTCEMRDGYWIERIKPRGLGKVKSLAFALEAMYALWRRRRDYFVIHAHLAFSAATAAVLMGRLLGRPVVVKFGNSGPQYGDVAVSQRTLHGRARLALLRRWASVIVVLDKEMQTETLRAGFVRHRVVCLENGIDANAYTPVAEPRPEGPVTVLYTGRLTPQKRLPNLLQAIQQSVAAGADVRLILAGDGADRPALQAQARALGLEDRVTFMGSVRDVRPLLQSAHIFALPSVIEGISNALLEAMAAGLACVATAVGGTTEVLDNGRAGILVPPEDVDSLARALGQLAADPAERDRLGQAARKRIMDRYDFSVVGARYQALYGRVTERWPR